MKKAALLAGLTSAALVACQLIAGIDGDAYTSRPPDPEKVDGGVVFLEASTAPQCGRFEPPDAPDIDDQGEKKTYIFALNGFSFSGLDPDSDAGDAAAIGYDLDRICSCDPLDPLTKTGRKTCALPVGADTTGCDPEGGIDNALAPLYKSLTAFSDLLPEGQRLIADQSLEFRCGVQNILLIVQEYNGEANDGLVYVSATPSYGTALEDGSTTPTQDPEEAGCGRHIGATFPSQTGSTYWSTTSTFDITANQFPGYVTNYQLVMNLSAFFGKFPFVLASQKIDVASPVVVADLVPVDGDGVDLPANGPRPAAFRIRRAVMAGRVLASTVLRAVGTTALPDGGGLFCDNALYPLLQAQVCNARDIADLPARDGREVSCEALSLAIGFTGYPTKLAGTKNPLAAPDAAGCNLACP